MIKGIQLAVEKNSIIRFKSEKVILIKTIIEENTLTTVNI